MKNVSKPQKKKGEKQMEETTKKRLIIAPKSMSLKLSRYIQEGIDRYIQEEEVLVKNMAALVEKKSKEFSKPDSSHDIDIKTLIEYRRDDILKIRWSCA
jgi:hypothetical protein